MDFSVFVSPLARTDRQTMMCGGTGGAASGLPGPQTAADAFERGLTPWLVTDASASHSGAEAHAAGLLVASKFIGKGQLINTSAVPTGLDWAPSPS